jgi:hypothetical protein
MKPAPMPEPPKRRLPAVDYDRSLLQNEKDHLRTLEAEILMRAGYGQYPGFAPDGLYCWMGAGPPTDRILTLEKVEVSRTRPVIFGERATTLLALDVVTFSLLLHNRLNELEPTKKPT